MVGIFRANNPFNTFILFVYGFLLKISWFIHPDIPIAQKTDGFLYAELISKLDTVGSSFPLVYPVVSYLLLFTQAITFNRLINDQRLMQKPNYIPAMSYLLITSMFREWNVLSSPLLINTLLIWVWARMSNLSGNNTPKTTLFNIGMVIGVSTFFYFPSLAFAGLIIFALIVTRPFKLQEWLIALIGIAAPWYFLFSFLYLTGRLQGYKMPEFEISYPRFEENSWSFAAICLVLTLFIIGAFYVQANFRRQLVQIRKKWSLILLYLVVATFVPFINATSTFEYWILTAVPLCAFIGCAFLYLPNKGIAVFLHWLMVLFVVALAIIKY